MTTPERSAVFNDALAIAGEMPHLFGGHPMEPLLPLAQKLVADVEVAIAAEQNPTSAPPPSTTPPTTPPSTTPPSTPPSPSGTGTPPPSLSGYHGIFQFTGTPIANPHTKGGLDVTCKLNVIAPTGPTLDRAPIDAAIHSWQNINKECALRLGMSFVPVDAPTDDTPGWVFDAVGVGFTQPIVVNGVGTYIRVPNYLAQDANGNWLYLSKVVEPLLTQFAALYDGNDALAWVQLALIGVYGENKVGTEQNSGWSSAQLLAAAEQGMGYTDQKWQSLLHAYAQTCRVLLPKSTLVMATDRTYIGGQLTADSWIAYMRTLNIIPQNDGFESTKPLSATWTEGVNIQEPLFGFANEGLNAATELHAMRAVPNVQALVVYGADITAANDAALAAVAQ